MTPPTDFQEGGLKQQVPAWLLVAAISFGGGFGGGTISRTDPWTATQATEANDKLEEQMKEWVDLRMRNCEDHVRSFSQQAETLVGMRVELASIRSDILVLQQAMKNLQDQLSANGLTP